MDTIKLHSSGQNDLINLLREKFSLKKKEISNSLDLNDSEKKHQLKKLEETFNQQKKDIKKNLF